MFDRVGKALINENQHPYLADIPVAADGLPLALSRQIMDFHKLRHLQPRHGRTTIREGHTYYRWCFSDLSVALTFVEQFGGQLSGQVMEDCAR